MSSWLKTASIDECHEFLSILINALFSIGVNVDEDKSMLHGVSHLLGERKFGSTFIPFLVVSQASPAYGSL